MPEVTSLAKVKLALRITHTSLDTEIQASIDAAKAEMARVGMLAVSETDALTIDAIKAYCKYSFASEEGLREAYFISWEYQLECLRKSRAYCTRKVTFTVTDSDGAAIRNAAIAIDTNYDNETDLTIYTNSAGIATYSTRQDLTDIDYSISKTGYTTVTGTAYMNGDEAVAVELAEV